MSISRRVPSVWLDLSNRRCGTARRLLPDTVRISVRATGAVAAQIGRLGGMPTAPSDEPAAQAHALVERLFALLRDCRALVPQLEAARTDP